MEKPIAVTIIAFCAGLWIGHAQAAPTEPAAGSSEAAQPQKKPRTDPCNDLTHEKNKSRDKKASTPTPAIKSTETKKP